MFSINRAFIVHGYSASPSNHWFVWLKNELEKNNVNTKIIDMPDSENPKLQSWINKLAQEIGKIDENTFIIGHSLGCISILRYLESLDSNNVLGGALFVSGFYESLPDLELLNPFTNNPLQEQKIINIIQERTVLAAKDDQIVPISLSKNLAKKIKAKFVEVQNGGHFMESDGFKELPIVLDLIYKN